MGKRILLVYAKSTTELLNRQSALGSYIFCLCEVLQKNGLQFFVNGIAFDELKKQASSGQKNTQINNNGLKKYLPRVFKQIAKDLLVFKNIKQMFLNSLQAGKYDCVLEFYSYGSDIGYSISKQQNIPLIIVYDAPVLEEYIFFHGNKYFFKNKILKRELNTLKQANKIIAYSNPVKHYLNKIAKKKLDVSIHQNVDFTRFEHIKDKSFNTLPINIGFIGSFLKWHKVDQLINAFNILRTEGVNAKLFLIGNGLEYPLIKKQAGNSIYSGDITMTGFIDGKGLYEYKKLIHIGVMPGSNWYGAPNKIFEYGAACMAVLAPATQTIADLFSDKQDLLLFDENSFDDFYRTLKELCENPQLCIKLAHQLQDKIINNYSEINTFNFYNGIFKDVMPELNPNL